MIECAREGCRLPASVAVTWALSDERVLVCPEHQEAGLTILRERREAAA